VPGFLGDRQRVDILRMGKRRPENRKEHQ